MRPVTTRPGPGPAAPPGSPARQESSRRSLRRQPGRTRPRGPDPRPTETDHDHDAHHAVTGDTHRARSTAAVGGKGPQQHWLFHPQRTCTIRSSTVERARRLSVRDRRLGGPQRGGVHTGPVSHADRIHPSEPGNASFLAIAAAAPFRFATESHRLAFRWLSKGMTHEEQLFPRNRSPTHKDRGDITSPHE